MSLAHLSALAAVGLACLVSSVVLRRTAPPRPQDLLESVYT